MLWGRDENLGTNFPRACTLKICGRKIWSDYLDFWKDYLTLIAKYLRNESGYQKAEMAHIELQSYPNQLFRKTIFRPFFKQ